MAASSDSQVSPIDLIKASTAGLNFPVPLECLPAPVTNLTIFEVLEWCRRNAVTRAQAWGTLRPCRSTVKDVGSGFLKQDILFTVLENESELFGT